jgi:group I intron endonuclease
MWKIYKIINSINNKYYIGLTKKPILKRLSEHIHNSFYDKSKKKIKFYRAIRKYGEAYFIIEEIDNAMSLFEANEKEIYHIKKYDSQKNGYNTTSGGDGTREINWSKETRELWSKQRTGTKHSLETRKKQSDAKIGKVTWMFNNLNSRKLTNDQYSYIKNNIDIKSQTELAKELNIHQSTISKLIKKWKTK